MNLARRRKTWLTVLLLVVVGVTAYPVVWPWFDVGARQRRAAEQALEQREWQEAGEHLKQGLAARPNDLTLRLLAAQTARRLGQFEEAERHLDFYHRKQGAVATLELEYRLLRYHKGELAETDRLLAQCADRPRDADTALILEAIIEGNLRTLNRAFALGVVVEGVPAAAQAASVRRAVDLWLQTRRTTVDRVQGMIWSSRLHFFGGEHARAVADLRAAVELAPENFEARRQLATTIAQEAPLETVAHFEELRRRRPNNTDVLYALAAIRRSLGELDEARRLLDELLAAEPDHNAGMLERGKVAQDMGQLDEAEKILRRVYERQPRDAETNLVLSRCLHRAGKQDEAKEFRDRFQQLEAEKQRQRDELTRKLTGPRP